ncbi:MAG: M67 family metallopeptidase [Gemmatimonadetes bacterium]|jgi:[CysO sulfur-carrier protein]-S-L-cysteine hydrolase|nr:M67 family metallopeptidase [Gemmatimonadota bacterium]
MFELSKGDLERIYAQAAEEYPAECCGILTIGADGGNARVHPCENIQDRLHAENPEKFSRDSRIAYYIDPQELYDIISSAEKAGGLVAGFYHSHIDCEAYFSEEDKERAMVWDEPAYPEAIYLVLSVQNKEVKGYKCFLWDAEKEDFGEVGLQVVD